MGNQTRPRDAQGRYAKAEALALIPAGELSELREAYGYLETQNMRLEERLEQIDMMIDAKGWTPLFDYGVDGGLSLEQVHAASKQLRELVVGNPFMKRGSQLRITYVWGGGCEFTSEREQRKGGKTEKKTVGLSRDLRAIMDRPKNQRNLFSPLAQETLERAAFTDGTVFTLGDDETKDYQVIPIAEIQGMLHNPDDSSEVWAYRRVWYRDPNKTDAVPTVRWYYTDSFPESTEMPRKTRIRYQDKLEVIDPGKTIFDGEFNAHSGWALGVPDGLAAIGWVRLYREFLTNGAIMSRALAQFAFRATMKSQDGANKGALQVGKPKGAGQTVFSSDDFAPLATAGKGYDFDSGRPLAAGIAAALEVSLVGLLSDPGAGGGASSSTAQTLDPPAKATAAMRRRLWVAYFERIFRHMGLVGTQTLKIIWHDLQEEQLQRILQAMILAHGTGLFEGSVIQGLIAEVLGIGEPGEVPDGYLVPNNKATAAVNAPKTNPNPNGTTGAGGSTAGSGQGQSSDGGQGANDHSTD
jgi:hypothetical protein